MPSGDKTETVPLSRPETKVSSEGGDVRDGAALEPLACGVALGRFTLVKRIGAGVLRGDTQHKDFWLLDLDAGTERQLTHFGRLIVRDFDLSPDGREIVFESLSESSDIELIQRHVD